MIVDDKEELLSALTSLNGKDYESVFLTAKTSSDVFAMIDQQAEETFSLSRDQTVASLVAGNKFLLTDEEPASESVFVYCDLSSHFDILRYVTHIRHTVSSHLGGGGVVRYPNLDTQHCTLFTEAQGKVDSELLLSVKTKYETVLDDAVPFNLMVKGPHISKDGGILLEVTLCSNEIITIKNFAETAPVTGFGRVVNPILFSTVGYIVSATADEMMQLWKAFREERALSPGYIARIREGKIIAAKNRRNIGHPIHIPFRGRPKRSLSDDQAAKYFLAIKKLSAFWAADLHLRNIVFEETLNWIECPLGPQSLAVAQELLLLS